MVNEVEYFILREDEAIFNAAFAACGQVYADWGAGDQMAVLRPRRDKDQAILVVRRSDAPRLLEYLEMALPGYDLRPHPCGEGEVAFAMQAGYWRVNQWLAEQSPTAPPPVPLWREMAADLFIVVGAWLIIQLERLAIRLNPALAAMDDPELFSVNRDDEDPPLVGSVTWG